MAQPATLRRLIDREQAPLPLSEPASLPALGLAVRQHMLDKGAQCSAAAAEAANPREALQDAFGSAAEAEGIADPDALGGDGGDVFQAPAAEMHAAKLLENTSELSDLEFAEQRASVLGHLRPHLLALFGDDAADTLDDWAQLRLPPVRGAADWFRQWWPEQRRPSHLNPHAFFMFLLLAPEALGAEGAEAAQGVLFGFRIQCARRPGQSRRPSLAPSVFHNLARLAKELAFYADAGIAVPAPPDLAVLVNDALAVRRVPDDGKARFCVWFRDANDELIVESFTMPAASDALADAEPEAWAMKRDLAKAFLQLQAHPADIELLGFVNPITGQVMLFTVPMFGLKSAPRCLHITVQAMCRATAVVARALGLLLMETNPALGEELYAAASRLRAYADDHFWASLSVAPYPSDDFVLGIHLMAYSFVGSDRKCALYTRTNHTCMSGGQRYDSPPWPVRV